MSFLEIHPAWVALSQMSSDTWETKRCGSPRMDGRDESQEHHLESSTLNVILKPECDFGDGCEESGKDHYLEICVVT